MEPLDRAPDGFIRYEDPDTGEVDRMAFWLPVGVTAADIGIWGGE